MSHVTLETGSPHLSPCLKLSCQAATGCWSPALVFGLNTCASTRLELLPGREMTSPPPPFSLYQLLLETAKGSNISLVQTWSGALSQTIIRPKIAATARYMSPTLSMDYLLHGLTYFWRKSGLWCPMHQNRTRKDLVLQS